MDPALRPVSTAFFPWARTGLLVGVVFSGGVATVWTLARTTAEVTTTVAERAPLVIVEPDANVPAARPVSAFAPIDVPWPDEKPASSSSSSSTTNGAGQIVRAGDSSLVRDEADTFFERALAPCAPTRTLIGKSVTWTCESAREESRAHIVPRTTGDVDGTWLRTSRTTFALPSDEIVPAAQPSCSAALRFVALPEGATLPDVLGTSTEGTCAFDVEGRPVRAWSTMLRNIFRPGTGVMKRALDDGTVTRWTAEAWDGDAWWRLDVVGASGGIANSARVHVQRWAPDAVAWVPPVLVDQKLDALEGCWEPCALALRTRADRDGANPPGTQSAVVGGRQSTRAADASPGVKHELGPELDRCLYECKGTEQAPARTEPTGAAHGMP